MNGVISKLKKEKGFGFIRDANGTEHFFHMSALVTGNFNNLNIGEKVQFRLAQSPKGSRAEEVELIP